MPSDNGTYVIQTYGPEYRIAKVSAVENLFEELNPDTMKWTPNVKIVLEAFLASKVYTELEIAWDEAGIIEGKDPTEFGVNLIRDFETLKFEDIKSAYENNK